MGKVANKNSIPKSPELITAKRNATIEMKKEYLNLVEIESSLESGCRTLIIKYEKLILPKNAKQYTKNQNIVIISYLNKKSVVFICFGKLQLKF